MAQWSTPLPVSIYSNLSDRIQWEFPSGQRPRISAALAPAGSSRFFQRTALIASTSGTITIRIGDSQTDPVGATGDDLTPQFETQGSITITVGALSHTIRSTNDPSDPYAWDLPPDRRAAFLQFIADVRALSPIQAGTFTLNDGATIEPTVAINQPASTTIAGGDQIDLTAIATVELGTINSYLWTADAGSFLSATSRDTTWTAPRSFSTNRTYTLTLTATDDNGNQGSDTIDITVRATAAADPTVVIATSDMTVDGRAEVQLRLASATNVPSSVPPGFNIYRWTGIGTFSPQAYNDLTTVVTWTAPEAGLVDAIYVLTVTAHDTDGTSGSDAISITVRGNIGAFVQSSDERLVALRGVREVLELALDINEDAADVYELMLDGGIVEDREAAAVAQRLVNLCGPPGWRTGISLIQPALDFTADGEIDRFLTDRNLASVAMNSLLGLAGGRGVYSPLVGWKTD